MNANAATANVHTYVSTTKSINPSRSNRRSNSRLAFLNAEREIIEETADTCSAFRVSVGQRRRLTNKKKARKKDRKPGKVQHSTTNNANKNFRRPDTDIQRTAEGRCVPFTLQNNRARSTLIPGNAKSKTQSRRRNAYITNWKKRWEYYGIV